MVGFTRNLGSTGERPFHLLVVEARFYEDIADELLAGATAALERAGATFERVTVPGAADVLGEMEKRDRDDSSRADSPLTLDSRYTLIDSTGRSVSAVVDDIEGRVRQVI